MAVFMIVMGLGIAGIWTADIVRRRGIDAGQGLLRARNPDDGSLFLPHWTAEYGTATALVTGGVGLLSDAGWATNVALVALGALLYTSTNALGWALAERERFAYAAPMAVGVAGGIASLVMLLG